MKKIIAAILCSVLSTLAAAPPAPAPAPAQRQCCGVRGELYGELLYLQPNGSNLYYAAEAIPFNPEIATPITSPNWNIYELSPNYRFGFEVGARTLFLQSNMTLEASWERLHSTEQRSTRVPLTTDMLGPFFDIGPNSAEYKIAKGKGVFHFDRIDLISGKKVCLPSINTKFYCGVSIARIKQTVQSTFLSGTGNISRIIKAPSTFTGAGPEFGVDFNYNLYADSIYFTGNSSISLLMGQLKNGTTFTSYSPNNVTNGDPNPNVQTTTVPNRTQLIPGFEEKLGFSFAANVGNCCKLLFDLGYRFQIYLNAVQSVDMTSQPVPTLLPGGVADVGVFAQGFARTLSNFILTGPYLSANVDF